jgi:uncharacterized protein
MAWRRVALVIALAVALASAVSAAGLPRRGFLGAVASEQNSTVTLSAVLAGSAAAQAGILAGDVVASVDGKPVATVAAFLAALHRPAGSSVTLGISRAGNTFEKSIVLPAVPLETDPHVDTAYGSIAIDGTLRRTLTSIPHGSPGKHPGVFFIGGIGCYSIDTTAPDAYRSLAHDLARRGFASLRLEKSGVGDSQGPPCAGVDFTTEAHSYAVALTAFRNDPAVDAAHVYLFGHSIGSYIAPRLALDQPVAGVIVTEAVARNWFEYELENERRQLLLAATPPGDLETIMRSKESCSYQLMIAKLPEDAIVRADPDCAQRFSVYPVTGTYVQQVADVNVASAWQRLAVPALVIYGASDFIVDEADQRYIEGIVNAAHPGDATLDVIADMDHYLTIAASQQESFDRTASGKRGDYNPKLSTLILQWLCAREQCS